MRSDRGKTTSSFLQSEFAPKDYFFCEKIDLTELSSISMFRYYALLEVKQKTAQLS